MENQTMLTQTAEQILEQVGRVIRGKDRQLRWVLAAILARGHILLEDIPGVGKTTMALAFSRTLGLQQGRVQFTPDVLPSDVTGYSVPDPETGALTYRPGAVLCNLFLADELNRATSRTQSALLEAMEEGQVTVDGVSHPLPQPFLVIATQNPAGAAGTQLLPDSQRDRFSIRLTLGYPEEAAEIEMVTGRQQEDPMQTLTPVLTPQQLLQLQQQVSQTYISRDVVAYIVALVTATRSTQLLSQGASPRASLAVAAMAKAEASLAGRDYVIPRDVQTVFVQTVAHRVILSGKAESRSLEAEQVLQQLLDTVPAPKLG